jgi:hypothetical protein
MELQQGRAVRGGAARSEIATAAAASAATAAAWADRTTMVRDVGSGLVMFTSSRA